MGAHLLKKIDLFLLLCLSFSFTVAQDNKIKSGSSGNEMELSSKGSLLPAVIVKSPNRKFKVTGDTISYPASAYLKIDIKKVEDLFKQLEGFRVDDRGKIFFNGKEVTRVLLDGEDLVGDQYRILSKNIQAGLIDTVKVYTHYNNNRILRDVEYEDKIAVDLRFRKDKRNRLNGSAESGYGILKKYNVDIDAVGIFKHYKLIGLADKNNIGLGSSFDQFTSNSEPDQQQPVGTNKHQSNPLAIPFISLPDIPLSYTLDNNDQNLSLIGSFKAGSFKNVKLESTVSDFSKVNSEQRNIQFFIPGNETWSRVDSYDLSQKYKHQHFKLTYSRDNEGNRISNYELAGSFIHNHDGYSNLRRGVITDSLYQKTNSLENLFSIHGKETIKLRKGFVIHSELFYVLSDLRSDLARISSDPFLTLQYDWTDKTQGYDAVKKDKHFTSSIFKVKGRINTRLSIHLSNEENKMASILNDKYRLVDENKFSIHFNAASWKSQGLVGFNVSKRIFMQADCSVGEGQVQFNKKASPTRTLFNLSYYLSYQKSPFNRWALEMSILRKMPSVNNIFPSPILGHNSTILYGTLHPSFPLVKNIDINYQRSDFYRGLKFYGSIAGSSIHNDNSISLFNYPDYMVKSFFISNRILQFRSNVQVEKYFNKQKLKIVFASNGFFMNSPERINNIDTIQSLLSKEFDLRTITNWQKIINIESGISFANNLVFGSRYDNNYRKSINQFKKYLKLKSTLQKNLFVSFQFSSISFNGRNTFYAGNGLINQKISKSIETSVMFHNLFNKSSFFEKQNDLYGSMSRMYFVQRRYILFSFHLSF